MSIIISSSTINVELTNNWPFVDLGHYLCNSPENRQKVHVD